MTAQFYDQLAPYYHLLYGDWEQSVTKQGRALSELLQDLGVPPGEHVLDAASGIGTQTIGLIRGGYRVTAFMRQQHPTSVVRRVNPDVRPYGLRYEAGSRFLAVGAERRDDVLFQPVLLGRRPIAV